MSTTELPARRPAVIDGAGKRWTWRGQGYAIEGVADLDWKGRPWTVTADTIRTKFGGRT